MIRRIWLCGILLSVSTLFAAGQCDLISAGHLEEGLYRNVVLGISYVIPDGFNASDAVLSVPDGSQLVLKADNRPNETIRLAVRRVTSSTETEQGATEKLLKLLTGPHGFKPLHAPRPVKVANNTWHRFDYGDEYRGKHYYYAVLVKQRSGFWLEWTFMSNSGEGLELLVKSLTKLEYLNSISGCILPIDSSSSASSATSGPEVPTVRVSEIVSKTFIVKQVTPTTSFGPSVNLKGTVVFRAVIDQEGRVISLQLKSGHPMLVPSAIEAAKQYIFKPYYLNGRPVRVETEISIPFD